MVFPSLEPAIADAFDAVPKTFRVAPKPAVSGCNKVREQRMHLRDRPISTCELPEHLDGLQVERQKLLEMLRG